MIYYLLAETRLFDSYILASSFPFEMEWLPLTLLLSAATVHTNLKDAKWPINLADGPSYEASGCVEMLEDVGHVTHCLAVWY